MDTPEAYARQLATYIASPTKIEALTRLEFGKAPPLHEIAEMRYRVERNARPRADLYCRDGGRDDGIDYTPPTLTPRPKPVRERDYIYVAPPRLPEPSSNPFLQPWRLTHALTESVAADFGLTPDRILGNARHRHLIGARSVVIKLLIDRGLGFAEVGRRMGRDHSTIIHRYRAFETDRKLNPRVGESYERHMRLLEEAQRELATRAQDNAVEAEAA